MPENAAWALKVLAPEMVCVVLSVTALAKAGIVARLLNEVRTHCPAAMHLKVSLSPTAVVILAEPGSYRLLECVSVQMPAKASSLTQPANPVPRLVMVAAPVMLTYSPEDEETLVVDAAAMEELETALVDLIMALRERM